MAVSTKSEAFLKVQPLLVGTGYLSAAKVISDTEATRALRRFQQRASTKYRKANGQPVAVGEIFSGSANGDLDVPTIGEIAKWAEKKWTAPVGFYTFKAVVGGGLRADVFDAWTKIETKIAGLGGTISGPYGNTKRAPGKASKAGASSFSFHITGRAIDLPQARGGGRDQRYYVSKETGADGTYWRIYCKTDKQDGTQGKLIEKNTVKYQNFSPMKEVDLPKGYYLDLTAEIEATGEFERIKAQAGWESNTDRAEWWHFQYKLDKQPTFLLECELVGYTEKDLLAAGYTQDDLDRAPG